MKGWSKSTTYIAVVMMAAGFLLIVLGWNGAAGLDYVQGQLPYIISGGLAGVALVGAGLTLALVQELRRSTLEITEKLDELRGSMQATGVADDMGPTEALNERQKRALERAGLN